MNSNSFIKNLLRRQKATDFGWWMNGFLGRSADLRRSVGATNLTKPLTLVGGASPPLHFRLFILPTVLCCAAFVFFCSHESSAQNAQAPEDALRDKGVALEISNGNYIELLEAEAADLHDVLKAISEESDYEIVVNDEITGKVSIFLTDIELRDALRIILDRLGLAFSEESAQINEEEKSIIHVMSLEDFESTFGYAFGQQLQTRIIPLVYIDPSEVNSVLEELKTPGGKIIYNNDTKTFILMDEPNAVKAMEDVIKTLDVRIETKEYTFKTLKANEIKDTLAQRLTKNVGRLDVSVEKNSITITDTLNKLQEIDRIIDDLDLAQAPIEIDIKVIQIILSDEHDTGVDWEAIVSDYRNLKFTAFDTQHVLRKDKELLSFGTISAEDLNILTEALETVGEIKTVFVDSFSAKNFEEISFLIPVGAVVSVDDDSPLKPYPPAAEDVKFYLASKTGEQGIVDILITPSKYKIADRETVNRKRQNILMRGVSKGADFLRSATRVLPGIGDGDERIAEGDLIEEKFSDGVNISVEDGSTIVIGTMIKEVFVKSRQKIPLLGDLPLLGFAFQSEGEVLRNSEIIAFITLKKINE